MNQETKREIFTASREKGNEDPRKEGRRQEQSEEKPNAPITSTACPKLKISVPLSL